jgi:hypothetical protein
MYATCAKCGQGATVRRRRNGFAYWLHKGALECPIVQKRMAENGVDASDACDDMMVAAGAVADRGPTLLDMARSVLRASERRTERRK